MNSRKFMSAAGVLALTIVAFGAPAIAADAMQNSSSAAASSSMMSDQTFVEKAAIGSAFEIESSQIALTHSKSDSVRNFARQMIDDHGKANDKLYAAASDANLTWPVAKAQGSSDATGSITNNDMSGARMGTDTGTTSPLEDSPVGGSRDPGQIGEGSSGGVASSGDMSVHSSDPSLPQGAMTASHMAELDAPHQAMLERLNKAEGAQFDALYLKQQAKAHAQTIDLLKSYKANGSEGALKSFAKETLPTVQEHEKMLRKIKAEG